MIRLSRIASPLATLSLLATICSCSSESSAPGPGGGNPDGSPGTGTPDGVKPVYALLSLVSTTETNVSYVNLFNSPDITSVNFSQAREFPGSSGIDVVNGKLFVSSGEAPRVMRFGLTDDLTWNDEKFVNFQRYGTAAGLWGNAFGSSTKGYMTFNEVDRVVWDPSALVIRSQNTAGSDLVRDRGGLLVRAAYDRSIVPQGNSLYWPYYWSDNDYYRFDQASQIAIYDTGTDQIRSLIDAPCPGLDFASKDEDGNLYFSNWVFAVSPPVFDGNGRHTCMVRVKAGETTIDPTFNSVRFTDVTGGREAAAFQYLGGGKGFFAVFHNERITGPVTDPKNAIYGNNWKFWSYDVNTKVAQPIDGIDYFAGGYRTAKVDGRTFLLMPRSDYASTVTYEVLADGTVKKLFESTGWAYQFIRVR